MTSLSPTKTKKAGDSFSLNDFENNGDNHRSENIVKNPYDSNSSSVKIVVSCPMVEYGCDWTGDRSQMRNHFENQCPYYRMKNVLDSYEEKLRQRDMVIQRQKKYMEELTLKKDNYIQYLSRELQTAQSLLQRYGINSSSSSSSVHDSSPSLNDLSRQQIFSTNDLLSDRRDQFMMQPQAPMQFNSLFGDPMSHSATQQLNPQLSDLIISPANKNKQQQQQQQQHLSPIGSKKGNYANVVLNGTNNGSNFLHPNHHVRLFDKNLSMSPINGINITPHDIVDPLEDELLDDGFVNQVINDMDDHDSNQQQYDPQQQHHQQQPLEKKQSQDDDDDSDEDKLHHHNTSTNNNHHRAEKISTPLEASTSNNGSIRYLLAGGGVGSIKVWDIADPDDCIMSLKGHTRFVSALHTHQGRVCSGSGDTSIRLWDFSTGECEKILSGCDGKVGALCSYNNILVSGSKDGATNHKIRLWNTDKAQCLRTLTGHSDWINVLCCHDKQLFSGSGDRTVRIWDMERGKCLIKYENPSFVLSLYHHAGHNVLYCGTYDGMIRTWDLRLNPGKVVKTVKAHGSGVLSLAHHDGLLCSGSKDETIRVWDYRTLGNPQTTQNGNNKWGNTNTNNGSVRTFVGHNNAVKCLISYNNRYLASGSYDRTVKLWDVTSASVSNEYASGDDGTNGEDVSVMTIETGFKCYSLSCFEQ